MIDYLINVYMTDIKQEHKMQKGEKRLDSFDLGSA